MLRIGSPFADWILAAFKPKLSGTDELPHDLGAYEARIKEACARPAAEVLWDKTVIDFGCGFGVGSVEMAKLGARRVYGIDNRSSVLIDARKFSEASGVGEKCEFAESFSEVQADIIVSIDAFEHFAAPEEVLRQMASVLHQNGTVIVSFGPTWYHPRGGHLFSVFPWAHLLINEHSLCRWRSSFRDDGATRFADVEGGLNQMTISRFLRLVNESPLRIAKLNCRAIGSLRWIHNRYTREFFTSCVQCALVKR